MRFFRKLFIGILAVLVLFLSFIAYLYYRFDPNEVLHIISGITEKKYGLSIQADRLRMDFRTGLDFQDLKILDTANKNVLINAKQGSIFYNPLALLKKNVDILNVKLSGVDETIPSIRTVIEKFSNARPSTNQLFHFELHSLTLEKSLLRIKPELALSINGTADFNNGFRNPSLRAELAASDGKGLPFGGKIRLEGKADRLDIRVNDVDLGQWINKTNFLSIHEADGTLTGKNGNWHFQGENLDGKWSRYSLKADHFTADLNSKKPLLLQLQSKNLFFNQSPAVLKNLTYDFQEKKIDIEISEIQAEISNLMPGFNYPGTLSGNIRIIYRDNLQLSGTVSLSNAYFHQVSLPEGRFEIENNAVNGRIRADLPGFSMESTLEKQNILDESPLKVRLNSKKLDLAALASEFLKIRNTQNSGENKAIGKPLIFPIEFSGQIDEAVWSNIKAENLSFNGTWDKTGLDISAFSMDFLGGDFLGRAGLRNEFLEGDFTYHDGKLRELTDILFHDEKIIYGTADLKGKFCLNPADVQTLSADFTAEANNGEIKNLFLQNNLRKLLFDIPLDTIFFDKISLTGKWTGGNLELQNLAFDSQDIRVQSSGNIDFQKKEIHAKSVFSFDKDYLLPLPNVAQILTSGLEDNGRIRFQVSLDGPFNKPSFVLKK